MAEGLTTSLLVTILGMGLVFGAILLFWLFMLALSWLGSLDKSPSGSAAAPQLDSLRRTEHELKRSAALAAVTVALAQREQRGPRPFPLPPTALVSTWQAVMRAKQLGDKGSLR